MASIRKRRRGTKPNGQPRYSKCFYIRYADHNGARREVKGYADREATVAKAATLERQAARRREGLVDRFDEHARRLLIEHADDYRRDLDAGGHAPMYVSNTDAWIRSVIGGAKAKYFAELTPSAVQGYLGQLAEDGLSPRTINNYLAAIQGFCNWAVKDKRLPASPLVGMARRTVAVDLRRRRRSLTIEDLGKLVDIAQGQPPIQNTSGPVRAMAYLLAGYLGLRRSEVGGLRLSDVDFDAQTITVRAAVSKNKRLAVLPMHPVVCERLRSYLAEHSLADADAPIVPIQRKQTGAMIRRDLQAAAIAFETDSGRVDFHSLRVSFASNLGRSGVPIQTARELMRHSTVELTARVYTKLELRDLEGAVHRLASPPELTPERQSAKATGTDGRLVRAPSLAFDDASKSVPKSVPSSVPHDSENRGFEVAQSGTTATAAVAATRPRIAGKTSGFPQDPAGCDSPLSQRRKAAPLGLEPRTCRTKICCATNCTTGQLRS